MISRLLVADKEELRVNVDPKVKRLIKAVIGVKEKDYTFSDVVREALLDWLDKPENVKLIEKHGFQDLRGED